MRIKGSDNMTTQEAIDCMQAVADYDKMFPPIRTAAAMAVEALKNQKKYEEYQPPCYRPGVDGCEYLVSEYDDEPIAKCQECNLCASGKHRRDDN